MAKSMTALIAVAKWVNNALAIPAPQIPKGEASVKAVRNRAKPTEFGAIAKARSCRSPNSAMAKTTIATAKSMARH
jgi:hypothetical protein